MNQTSQKLKWLDARLLKIEEYFHQRDLKRAVAALDRLEKEGYSPEGINKGLYLLLLARKAVFQNEYESAIALCRRAFDDLASTSLNSRIGRLQLLLYKAHVALGELKLAQIAAGDALASFRRAKDDSGIVDAYNALGRTCYIQSEYARAAEYVSDAIPYAACDPVKEVQLLGNLGRIYLLTGEMDNAEENLHLSLNISRAQNLPHLLAADHLSLGYLYLRRRQFHLAESEFDSAREVIDRNRLKRELAICMEYQGELAFEKQDYITARRFLKRAIEIGKTLAPESAILSQSLRRRAEVELELDHNDKAMRLAQVSLDLAQKIGEKAEVGLAHRVISRVFLARNEVADARRHSLKGIEVLRQTGDNYELGRSIIAYGRIALAGSSQDNREVISLMREAEKLFGRLGDAFYLAKCQFEMGRLWHRAGRNGEALEYLKKAVSGFRSVGDRAEISKINEFLRTLSESAINKALSRDNEFKIFGKIISGSDYKNLKNGPLEVLFEVLIKRTAADRGFIINMVQGQRSEMSAAHALDEKDFDDVMRRFDALLKDRVASDVPTLALDCTNDADFVDILSTDSGHAISLLILPLILGRNVVGYIYLDRVANDNGSGFNPFSQREIDFAVGFADLVAFKTSEYQKERLLEDNYRLKAQLMERCIFPNIVTQSRPFMEMLSRVRQVADSSMPISITGETGTGKDLLAKAIHYNSNRRDKRFISVNCAALPESLLESELFGYKRGAFTGADRDKPGLFEEADGGTFFLDEIADMPQSIQAKLLRVLENQEITRLGDTKPRKVDVRVISATNRILKAEMEKKRFRSDLYYRLCALNFTIPPLRDRKEDIPLLVDHFLSGSKCRISPDALKYLIDWDWPGNVRELENEVKKLVLLANNEGTISPSLLSSRILGEEKADVEDGPDEMAFYTRDGFSLYNYLAEYEKRFIIKALKEQRGVKKRAADSLNIPESTLRLKLKQYGIDPKRPDSIN
jgi:transcriptional regulator with GAF, ATPase, and Fis domain